MRLPIRFSSSSANVSFFALVAAFGGFVFGLDAANISGALRVVSAEFELDSIQQGTLVGCALIGVILALFFTGTLCEKFGRARVLLAIGFTYSLSSLLSALAVSYEMLLIGRFIGGVAFASITVSAMYIGEIAPAHQRGKFVSINQFMIGLGLLCAFVINYFLVKSLPTSTWLTNDNIWRIMLGAELIEVDAVPYANPGNYIHTSERLAKELNEKKLVYKMNFQSCESKMQYLTKSAMDRGIVTIFNFFKR